MIKKYESIRAELDVLRASGVIRGESVGFECFDALYSLKQGSFTIILGAPHHGKSEFCFEILFNQAKRHGKKALIYSPETGSVADIYAEFIHKYTGKSAYKNNNFSCSDKEYYEAINWIDGHFNIVDSDLKAYSFRELMDLCTDEKIILGDPYNEINHNMSEYGTRQDLYIEAVMGEIRREMKNKNRHFLISIHPANQQIKEENGIRYYPMPFAREAAGGQALLRKAMTWINIWRPSLGLRNQNGMPYLENELVVNIEKAKPKGVSFKGTTSIYFDWKRNRYFEKIDGNNCYAFEHESGAPKFHADSFVMPQSNLF